MKSRLTILSALLVAVALILSACGGQQAPEAPPGCGARRATAGGQHGVLLHRRPVRLRALRPRVQQPPRAARVAGGDVQRVAGRWAPEALRHGRTDALRCDPRVRSPHVLRSPSPSSAALPARRKKIITPAQGEDRMSRHWFRPVGSESPRDRTESLPQLVGEDPRIRG